MLVLSRRVGQEIMIGDIRLVVVGQDGRRVRLAIDAPADVKILRQELVESRDLVAVGPCETPVGAH